MGGVCCGNSGGRAMTHAAVVRLQSWARGIAGRKERNNRLRAFLSSIGNIESPRNPGQKMIDAE
jgi:hypothetical protein